MPMSSVMRLLRTICLAASACFISANFVNAAEALPPELEKLKAALEKYKDPVVAVRDGYFSTLGCVMYESGTMGVHFLNPRLIGPKPDPMQPTSAQSTSEPGRLPPTTYAPEPTSPTITAMSLPRLEAQRLR